jgi:hypothetical protein
MNNELDINTISGLSEAEAAQRLKTEGYMFYKEREGIQQLS